MIMPLLSPYAKDYHELLSSIVETRSNMISCACGRIHWSKNMNHRLHHIDAIVSAMASQITSVLIFHPTVYSQAVQRNIKHPRHWPMWGEFNGERWISRTKGVDINLLHLIWNITIYCIQQCLCPAVEPMNLKSPPPPTGFQPNNKWNSVIFWFVWFIWTFAPFVSVHNLKPFGSSILPFLSHIKCVYSFVWFVWCHNKDLVKLCVFPGIHHDITSQYFDT